jgi:hypothetical protein
MLPLLRYNEGKKLQKKPLVGAEEDNKTCCRTRSFNRALLARYVRHAVNTIDRQRQQ